MGRLLCRIGWHRWHREHIPGAGSRYAWVDTCTRCGKDKTDLGGTDSPGAPTWW